MSGFAAKAEDVRLRNSVNIDEKGCWRWKLSKFWNGYGHFRASIPVRRSECAHRASYRVFVGPIPAGLDVCHKCDVRDCINPDHLFVGTRSENIRDCVSKGRNSRTHQAKGEAHGSAKLTADEVLAMRASFDAGATRAYLADKYGVSWTLINLIVKRQSWRHLPEKAA